MAAAAELEAALAPFDAKPHWGKLSTGATAATASAATGARVEGLYGERPPSQFRPPGTALGAQEIFTTVNPYGNIPGPR
jgi:hypothetical protein